MPGQVGMCTENLNSKYLSMSEFLLQIDFNRAKDIHRASFFWQYYQRDNDISISLNGNKDLNLEQVDVLLWMGMG